MESVPNFCLILTKLEISRYIEVPNIKSHENSPSESRVIPCGQTDGHNEANSGFSRTRLKKSHLLCILNPGDITIFVPSYVLPLEHSLNVRDTLWCVEVVMPFLYAASARRPTSVAFQVNKF